MTFEAVHEEILHLLPEAPVRAVDIGAGTGRDAAALAGRGHEVIAVEPVRQLRLVAQRLHADANVVWLEDSLPGLEGLDGEFGLILLSAVWMHLDEQERAAAMGRLAELLAPGGLLVISLRHGPPPTDRRMFDVPADETAALARECGLSVLQVGGGQDQLGRNEIHWSELALRKDHA
ncbi:bifunctional 2-polyprenyl-6-hydroxyphenol methylase/3-demethylubiquinol 3-O-methyltransferase UbiG [Streptomyces sp. ISL-98]|uniref:class I SAM-dependent methyltransferase n=1 Tax=Streptomyces sp. ISL-98 TaxID=2819192 RepID=UPI0020352913|nr:class I SAM-dependent methyltransferase [Streptomyces sp. ISL-98]